MRTGFYRREIWSISYENLATICPKEIEAIDEVMDEFGGWVDLCIGLQKKDSYYDPYIPLVEDLQKSFAQATGLRLSFLYYDEDSQMTLDVIDTDEGFIFQIHGVYEYEDEKTKKLSAAASNMKNMIKSFEIFYPC